MTFYQELQLSSTGSKQLIKNTTDPKEKRRHILIYNFKGNDILCCGGIAV